MLESVAVGAGIGLYYIFAGFSLFMLNIIKEGPVETWKRVLLITFWPVFLHGLLIAAVCMVWEKIYEKGQAKKKA